MAVLDKNNNDNNQSNDSENKILEFCKKNIRYIAAGVVVVLLIIVLALTAWKGGKGDDKKPVDETKQEQGQDEAEDEGDKDSGEEAFVVDSIPEINTLISNYYAAYAAGNADEMAKYAAPITDVEKSYIGVFSQYVTGYENIKCYMKPGLEDGSYLVSVSLDMRFEGVETTAPGLDFFYVRTKDGGYYIDNVYSQFNLQYKEQPLDSKVEERINSYIKEKDVVELQTSVQERYSAALASDPNLNTIAVETVPQAVKTWKDTLTANAGDAQQPAEGEQQPQAPAEQPPEAPAEQPAEAPAEQPAEAPAEQPQKETVYATDNINIRKEPNEASEKVGSAVKGGSFTRTGTTDDGWSSIEFNGGTAYIKSEFLSTEAVAPDETPQEQGGDTNSGINYVPEGTTLTMNSSVNIRSSMSETSDKMGTAAAGDKVKVILSYKEGWTKVEWNGKTGYIKTDLLLNN